VVSAFWLHGLPAVWCAPSGRLVKRPPLSSWVSLDPPSYPVTKDAGIIPRQTNKTTCGFLQAREKRRGLQELKDVNLGLPKIVDQRSTDGQPTMGYATPSLGCSGTPVGIEVCVRRWPRPTVNLCFLAT